MKKILLLLGLAALCTTRTMSNNVTITNISLVDPDFINDYIYLEFDIGWDNSWRISTAAPYNWDACWIFAKYRMNGGDWLHCTLSSIAGQHTAPSGSTLTPANGTGAFIYRSADGNGNNNWTGARLRWNYGADGIGDDAIIEVKLFAIEMVYVPEATFYLGDGNGSDESIQSFHTGTTNSSVEITSSLVQSIRVDFDENFCDDSQLQDPGIGIDGDGGLDADNNGTIDNLYFPTGYNAFYIMKYEISQEQYAEFLNTLTRAQQINRVQSNISGTTVANYFVMTNSSTPGYSNNNIRCNATIPAQPAPVFFYCDNDGNGTQGSCDGQYIPCNWLSWPDGAAYADWAGLRPMTELEFEKASRGTNNPVLHEYAWGNTNITTGRIGDNYLDCNNEYVTLNPDTSTGRAIYFSTKGTANHYFYRCGNFAASSVHHTRQETGATYYGAMEMSGTLLELVVTVGNVAGRSYRAIHGNGGLNTNGYADVDYWPGINGNDNPGTANGVYGGTTGVTGSGGSGAKGGSYWTSSQHLYISDRNETGCNYYTARNYASCNRCVRSAP